jgi:hypothetical protein
MHFHRKHNKSPAGILQLPAALDIHNQAAGSSEADSCGCLDVGKTNAISIHRLVDINRCLNPIATNRFFYVNSQYVDINRCLNPIATRLSQDKHKTELALFRYG